MQKILFTIISMLLISNINAQSRFSSKELSVNGFRNPSIGLEYRKNHVSVHAGYYITALEAGITTKFFKAGVTTWFLPVGKKKTLPHFMPVHLI